MIDMDDVIARMTSKRQRPIPEAQIMRLQEVRVTYDDSRTKFMFKPGDIVTAMPYSIYKTVGEPHIVLEVIRCDGKDREDMRVACITDGDTIGAFWVESWYFVAYRSDVVNTDLAGIEAIRKIDRPA